MHDTIKHMTKLGTKIVVVGVSAAGKSTFSRKLTHKIDLPLTHMDSIMWKPGWNYIGDDETVRRLDEISSGPQWIIEGYISKEARTFIFDRADSIIYLDYSPLVSSWRYTKRCLKHRNDPRPELKGSPENFSFRTLHLVWTKGEAITLNTYLKQVKAQDKITVLRSPREAKKFLRSIE
jgi:adenylate kinase family enzyme